MGAHNGKIIRAKMIAYEVLAEHNPDPWSPAVITDELVEEVHDRLKPMYQSGRGSGQAWLKRSIRAWLEDPSTHDPHVDEIAVERAVALDHTAYMNLTELEARIVRERLSHMEDPWGLGSDVFSDSPAEKYTSSAPGFGRAPRALDARGERWCQWPRKDARSLRDAVTARRGRRPVPAAA